MPVPQLTRAGSGVARKPTKLHKGDRRAIRDSASTIIDHASSPRAWLQHPKSRRSSELKLMNSILEKANLPVPVEQPAQHVAQPVMALPEEDLAPLSSGMVPGTLIEVRLKHTPFIGVVWRECFEDGQTFVQTLLLDGTVVTHFSHDVHYAIPDFMSPNHMKRCGNEKAPANSKELMARVSVAEKIRAFQRAAEDLSNGYAAQVNTVYPHVRAPNKDEWATITVAEAARILNLKHANPQLCLHAVYSRLMKESHMFVMDGHNFLSSQKFYVKPPAHVDRFTQVQDLMHADGPRVKGFVERAKGIISRLRSMPSGSKNRTPTYEPVTDLTFTEDDQLFIQFLLDSLVDMRSAQVNQYTPFVCDIIKAIGQYPGDVDSSQVRQLLQDMGVFAPWQDFTSVRRTMPDLTVAAPESVPPTPSSSASGATSGFVLGPEDLYPSDLLESLRHDFGQLTVYTIDDYGAEELDDGISIERDAADPSNLWIHIHVADPTAVLPPTHLFSRRARDVAQTQYFQYGSQAMLPDSLVDGKLSLGHAAESGAPETVMTFSAKIDPSGDIVEHKVRAGIVRNVRVLKYDEVDAAMNHQFKNLSFPFGQPAKAPPAPLNLTPQDMENLHLLDAFCKRVVARRLKSSTFSFGLERPSLIVSPKPLPIGPVDFVQPGLFRGAPQVTYAVARQMAHGSRQIVSEAAQIANRVVSRFGLDHGIPLVRRSLPAPKGNPEALADLLRLRDNLGSVDFFEVRRKGVQFQMGGYTLEPAEHWTIGVEAGEGYVRATSPLRRYADLLTHWQIKHAMLHKKSLFSPEEMQAGFEYIGKKERRAKWIDYSHSRWWALSFIKQWMERVRPAGVRDPLKTLTGRITSIAREDIVHSKRVQDVHIAELGLLGNVEVPGTGYEVGGEVALSIDEILLTIHPVLRLKLRAGHGDTSS
ncbi:hypothetical protein BC834DRAFT_869781 [Gloeopeniophorella convolvens]|nr:hypothetical protein BC834DRAFT_869781 [Gloeopeniophorella convolvens]